MSGSKHSDSAPTLRPPPMPAETAMIISTNFSVTGFGKRWAHCHQLANYLARYASANENDPERSSTLLSTFFNELLEAIYRNHAKRGQISIKFEKRVDTIIVEAEVPVDEASVIFYQRAVELANQPDPMGWYRDQLEHDLSEDDARVLGLLELAVVYGARFTIGQISDLRPLHLTIEFPFMELDEV
jgi:hypothetical protein